MRPYAYYSSGIARQSGRLSAFCLFSDQWSKKVCLEAAGLDHGQLGEQTAGAESFHSTSEVKLSPTSKLCIQATVSSLLYSNLCYFDKKHLAVVPHIYHFFLETFMLHTLSSVLNSSSVIMRDRTIEDISKQTNHRRV